MEDPQVDVSYLLECANLLKARYAAFQAQVALIYLFNRGLTPLLNASINYDISPGPTL